jgi:hypothetical protein
LGLACQLSFAVNGVREDDHHRYEASGLLLAASWPAK